MWSVRLLTIFEPVVHFSSIFEIMAAVSEVIK